MNQDPPATTPARPEDVATGFWLWLISLPLLLTGYLVDAFTAAPKNTSMLIHAITAMFALMLGALVLTFLLPFFINRTRAPSVSMQKKLPLITARW